MKARKRRKSARRSKRDWYDYLIGDYPHEIERVVGAALERRADDFGFMSLPALAEEVVQDLRAGGHLRLDRDKPSKAEVLG